MAEQRRTKRRYAHELYPHANEGETRPLDVEVPYLYAIAVGLNLFETDWFDLFDSSDESRRRLVGKRAGELVDARRLALLADAIHQGMTGQESWDWADQRSWDEEGGIVYDRAVHYDVAVDHIKPYPVLAEATSHGHYSMPDQQGWRYVTGWVGIPESECPDCTEPVEADGDA